MGFVPKLFSQALLPTLWGSFCTYIYSEAPAYFNAFLWGSSADNCAFIGLDSKLSLRLFCRYHFLFRACFKALDCLSMQFLWGSCHAFDSALSTLQTQGSLRLPEAQGPDARAKVLFFDPPPVDFVFCRFSAYMGPWMTFRANPGTTRPPLALASTSRAERVG